MIEAQGAGASPFQPERGAARFLLLVRIMGLAILLHNVEEWWSLPLLPGFLADTRALLDIRATLPPLETVRWGLIAFTAVPVAILLTAGPTSRGRFIACMIASMSAGNALFPHIVMGLTTGGYVPGLVTACVATLPLGLFLLWEAHRLRLMPLGRLMLAVGTGLLLLPAVLTGFWALGELMLEINANAGEPA